MGYFSGKNREKSGEIGKNREESGKIELNREEVQIVYKTYSLKCIFIVTEKNKILCFW
jgi:hypothetical protein